MGTIDNKHVSKSKVSSYEYQESEFKKKVYREAICKNIFIGLELKISKGNVSQAICTSAIPLSKKRTALHQFPAVGDSTFLLIRVNRIVL
jgi:hypothetical protein